MKVLLILILFTSTVYGQNNAVYLRLFSDSRIENAKIESSVNFLSKPTNYRQKFKAFVLTLNQKTTPFTKKSDFYKAYSKANNALKENKKIVFKDFSPQFNHDDFSLPLRYKYKNGSTCFYLLRGCKK